MPFTAGDNAKTAGAKGGLSTKKKYGSAYYRSIGRLGGYALLAQKGREFYQFIGKLPRKQRVERKEGDAI